MHFAGINFFPHEFLFLQLHSQCTRIVHRYIPFCWGRLKAAVDIWELDAAPRVQDFVASVSFSWVSSQWNYEFGDGMIETCHDVTLISNRNIKLYRNDMKWWWFILKPWVFPCGFTTPKKFPLTGAWVELGGAKHPPIFDRARTTHRKYQRFGRPLWKMDVSLICQQPVWCNPDRFPTNCSHWGFPPTPAPFPPTPQIDDMVWVPVSFGNWSKVLEILLDNKRFSRFPYLLCVQQIYI